MSAGSGTFYMSLFCVRHFITIGCSNEQKKIHWIDFYQINLHILRLENVWTIFPVFTLCETNVGFTDEIQINWLHFYSVK